MRLVPCKWRGEMGAPGSNGPHFNPRSRWIEGVGFRGRSVWTELQERQDVHTGAAGLHVGRVHLNLPSEVPPNGHHPQEAAEEENRMEWAEMRLHDGHLLVRVLQ